MESINYNFFNENLGDINDENKDSDAPPSIVQSQIDISPQHSELSNSSKEKNIDLDMDKKSNSEEKKKQ
jgi:hypothetical protein